MKKLIIFIYLFFYKKKLWEWDLRGLEYNKCMKSFQTIQYDTHKTSKCTAWGVCWSCLGNYAMMTFSKEVKRRQENSRLESVIYVYNAQSRQMLRTLDRTTTPLKYEYQIMIIEAHPFREDIALTADYNGQIVLWNILEGVILNVY